MRNITLVTIIGLIALFSLPFMSATWLGGQNAITNVSGNLTPLDFVITTVQNTTNPGIGQNVTYISQIQVSARAYATFNLTNFSFNLPDNNTFNGNVDFVLNNATGLNSNETPDVFTMGQAADQYGYVTFYGMTAFSNASTASNGTQNATTWNLTWVTMTPVASTKISSALSGRAYTETWNITNANSNLTVDNSSLVVTPTWYNLRIGVPTTVTFNATSLTTSGYSTNYTDIECWTDLDIGTNMLEYGSGYETLSITYNGPVVSGSSGSSPSTPASTPQTTRNNSIWLIVGLCFIVVAGLVTVLVVMLRKR